MLIFQLSAKVEAVRQLVVQPCTAGEHPKTLGDRFSSTLLEVSREIKATSTAEAFDIGIEATVGAVVAWPDLIGHLLGAWVLVDDDLMEGELRAPVGLEVEGCVRASSERLLWRVIWVAERKRTADL